MVVISYKTIRDFSDKHIESRDPLNNWYTIIEKGDFANFNELRTIFNSVDAVGNDRYVFNIKGNKYRLLALIQFNIRTVYILFVGTHSEYDKTDASKIKFKKQDYEIKGPRTRLGGKCRSEQNNKDGNPI